MNTFKKLLVGFAAVAILVVATLLFIGSAPVRAAPSGITNNPQDIKSCTQNLTFVSIAEIDCTFTPVGAGSQITIRFIDSNPSDGDGTCWGWEADSNGNCARKMNYAQQADSSGNLFFANGEPSSGDGGISGDDTVNPPGITIENSVDDIGGRLSPEKASLKADLKVNLEYADAYTGQIAYPCRDFSNPKPPKDCTRFNKDSLIDTDNDVSGATMVGAKTKGIANLLQFNSNGVSSLDGVTDGDLANLAYTYDKSYTSGPLVFTQNFNTSPCIGEVIIANDATGTNSLRVVLNDTNQPLNTSYPRLLAYLNSVGASGCGVDTSKTNFYGTTTGFNILGTFDPSKASGGGGVGGGGGNGSTSKSCESNLNSAFSWIICPILSLADQAIGGIYGLVENQLCFNINVGSSSTTGNIVCRGSPNTIVDGIQSAWTIFKNIASALLVIVMLVMVFSQAVGGGPFEAYTVRKTLPKLVAAVILMQLSYVLLRWTIDLSNDAGSAIGSLIMAPFGGPQNMSLQSIVGKIVTVAAGHGGTQFTFDFFASIAAIGGAIWALPALPLLALYVISGVLIAFFTLIIRKLLIIMLVMLAPLALIAWVLPGTDNYWKLWRTNFTKLLTMFPLIMAMLASGRVLAYITSQAGSASLFNPRLAIAHLGPLPVPYFASVTGFADLAIVVGAFFAPYFLIPKTFSWGGGLMKAAGGAVNKIGANATKKAEEPLKGWTQRKRDSFGKKYLPPNSPASKYKAVNWANRTKNSLLGGRVLPTRYQSALLSQRGDKWNDERDAEALTLLKRKGEKAREGYETALLSKDKTSFAKYSRDEHGNLLDKGGKVVYKKSGVGADGKDTYTDALTDRPTSDFSKAHRIKVGSYAEADKRTLKGVQAMKQMWVDEADQSKNKNERKMAIRQLIATASWPEIQGSLSRDGNKVIDTKDWSNSINTSPEDYPKILRSRVDAAPHVDDIAKQRLAQAKAADPSKVWTKQMEKDYISQQRILYSIKDQMSNEDFQSQSEGYWDEVARVANLGGEGFSEGSAAIREALRNRFQAIHDIKGTAPQQLLGHLVGGSIEGLVDTALGPGDSIRDYVNLSSSRVLPGSSEEAFQSMQEPAALAWISVPGRVETISDSALKSFAANAQPGELKRITREEMIARGMIKSDPPVPNFQRLVETESEVRNPQPNPPGSTVTPDLPPNDSDSEPLDEGGINVPHDNT